MSSRLIHLLLLLCLSSWLRAQLYPVEVFFSAQMNFPANVQALSQEFGGLQLTLRLRDLAAGSADVRLRFTLENQSVSVSSSTEALVTPLTLPSGVPVVLIGADLQAYFLPQNLALSGLTREQFLTSGGDLPEGLYTLCVEVLDYRRPDAVLSDLACTMTSLDLLDPPLITAPYEGEVVPLTDSLLPLPLNIQWLMNYSTVVFPVDYHLYIYPYGSTAQQFGLATGLAWGQPLFETMLPSSLLTLNNYLYGLNGEVERLSVGQRYVLRIHASTVDGRAYFRQQGWSEPVVFQYGEITQPVAVEPPCNAPVILETSTLEPGTYQVLWSALPQTNAYEVLLEVDGAVVDSFIQADTLLTLHGLDTTLTYVGRIQATCARGRRVISEPFYLSGRRQASLPVITFACGVPVTPLSGRANTTSIESLNPGDTIMAGDFKVQLTSVDGGPGGFNGDGIVLWNFPFRNFSGEEPIQLQISFRGILVNTDYFMYAGSMEVQGLGIELIPPELSDFLTEFGELDLVADEFKRGPALLSIDFTIRQVIVGPGTITIEGTDSAGQPVTQTYAWEGEDTEVLDQTTGQFYVVDENGQVNTPAGQLAEGGPPTEENTTGVNKDGLPEELTRIGVVFSAGASVYAFDDVAADASENEKKLYFSAPVAGTEERYYAAYKAIKKGAVDVLQATIVSDSVQADKLVFMTRSGRLIPHRGAGSVLTLEATGLFTSATETILACQRVGETFELVGFFRLMHVPGLQVRIIPLALGEASIPADLAGTLQRIYGPVAVDFTMGTSAHIDLPADLLTPDGAIETGSSSSFANYTPGLQKLNAHLRQTLGQAYQTEAYYLVFAGAPSSSGLAGFMPLARQFGYVFQEGREENKGATALTAAHELGHGIFMLEHPFTRFDVPQSSTDWLMDYGGGMALPHVHWSQIYDPELRLYLFQEDEEGGRIVPEKAFVTADFIFFEYVGPKNDFSAITPTNEIVTLPKGAIASFYSRDGGDWSKGCLIGFDLDQKKYLGWWNPETKIFKGYFETGKDSLGKTIILNREKYQITSERSGHTFAGYIDSDCFHIILSDSLNPISLNLLKDSAEISQVSLEKFSIYESLKVEGPCGCKLVSECTDLLIKYKDHPYLQEDDMIRQVICQNPCILQDLEHYNFFANPESEWMKDFNMVFGFLLNSPFVAAASGFLISESFLLLSSTEALAVLRAALAAFGPALEKCAADKSKDFAIGFLFDCSFQYAILKYFPSDNDLTDNEILKQIDYTQALASGAEATIELNNKYAQFGVSAAISCLVDGALDHGKIKEDFSFKDCAIGALSATLINSLLHTRAHWTYLRTLPRDKFLKGLHYIFRESADDVVKAGASIPKSFAWTMWKNVVGETLDAEAIKQLLRVSDEAAADLLQKLNLDPSIIKDIFESGKFIDLWDIDLPDDLRGVFFTDLFDGQGFRDLIISNLKAHKIWEVLSILPQTMRINSSNIDKLSKYFEIEKPDLSKLKSSLANAKDAQKWIDLKIPSSELDKIYNGMRNDQSFDPIPWTKEHKAQRWKNYETGCINGENTCLDFETWSNGYDGKIDLVVNANKSVDDYFNSLGWGCLASTCREQTLKTIINGQSVIRRLDIFDHTKRLGKEFKEYSSEKVYKSEDIINEIIKDKQLMSDGQILEMEWVFKGCEPSGPLRVLLESFPNPIKITIIQG